MFFYLLSFYINVHHAMILLFRVSVDDDIMYVTELFFDALWDAPSSDLFFLSRFSKLEK